MMKGAVYVGVLCFVFIGVTFGVESPVPSRRRGPQLSAPAPVKSSGRRTSAAQSSSRSRVVLNSPAQRAFVNPPNPVPNHPAAYNPVHVGVPVPRLSPVTPQPVVFPKLVVPNPAPINPNPVFPAPVIFFPTAAPFNPKPVVPYVPTAAPFNPRPVVPFVPTAAPFNPRPVVPFVPTAAPFNPKPAVPFVPTAAPFNPRPFVPFVPTAAPFNPRPVVPFVPTAAPFNPRPAVPFPTAVPFNPRPFVPFVPTAAPLNPRPVFPPIGPIPSTFVPTAAPVSPVSLCFNGNRRVACHTSTSCNNVLCKAYPNAECRMDTCNFCAPRFFVQNVAVSCDMCRNGYRPTVAPTNDPVTGMEDACRFANCGLDEHCQPNYCTLPQIPVPVFQCVPNCRDTVVNQLIGDGKRKECLLDPCYSVTCPFNYECKANLCTCSGVCVSTKPFGAVGSADKSDAQERESTQPDAQTDAPTTHAEEPETTTAQIQTESKPHAAAREDSTTTRDEEHNSVTTNEPIAENNTNAPSANEDPVLPQPVEDNHSPPN